MARGVAFLLCVAALLAAPWVARAQQRPVDLELVLAVDNSLSVNQREFALQILGIADAFGDTGVVRAILSHDGIAVALVLWSNHEQQETGVDWTLLRDKDSIAAFAAKVARVSRIEVSGGTGIGAALTYALRLFGANAFSGERRTIDISGDGQNNMGIEPSAVRDKAAALGITINGLAILDEEPRLDRYYAASVVGGPGAFLETATDFDAFAAAMRRKLRREIGGQPVAVNSSD